MLEKNVRKGSELRLKIQVLVRHKLEFARGQILAACERDGFLEEMAQRDCRALQMQSKYNFFSIAPFQPRPFCDSAKAVECTQVPAQKNGPEMDRS